MKKCLGVIRLAATDYVPFVSESYVVGTLKGINLPVKNTSNKADLYFGFLSNNTLTLTTTASFLSIGMQSR
jgi:hypothetical protein